MSEKSRYVEFARGYRGGHRSGIANRAIIIAEYADKDSMNPYERGTLAGACMRDLVDMASFERYDTDRATKALVGLSRTGHANNIGVMARAFQKMLYNLEKPVYSRGTGFIPGGATYESTQLRNAAVNASKIPRAGD